MSDRLQIISNSLRSSNQGDDILTPGDASLPSTLNPHTETLSQGDISNPTQIDQPSQTSVAMPPKEPIKAVTNKRTRSTKTSAKAATEPANGKTPAIQKGLLSPEEAQMIERLGTGTEEPEETKREQVRVVNKPQGNAGLSSLKFKKVSKTTWTDEDIARVIEKYLAADKIGDKETSDTFYAVELLKSADGAAFLTNTEDGELH
ncbi:hypothetical protein Pst134EA_022929 [Puccinia striiformis f. sp. tritici]|uniref:hypothetical protein n=1 Tax=Puccinia striiformis f. sp. tritici TaxID=168172 RepID=UPI002008771D|nr:hypothetical protein Pst134EA_022929 [Puccinia striiformis f. sp. tritici]KAH9455467.1 hypothetical protein Pst134EA_022929 [Puccinia striiformis f. sp. tritici]